MIYYLKLAEVVKTTTLKLAEVKNETKKLSLNLEIEKFRKKTILHKIKKGALAAKSESKCSRRLKVGILWRPAFL